MRLRDLWYKTTLKDFETKIRINKTKSGRMNKNIYKDEFGQYHEVDEEAETPLDGFEDDEQDQSADNDDLNEWNEGFEDEGFEIIEWYLDEDEENDFGGVW